jgi:succinate-semialdehyde dehydrogenase/glutarate-semialdehyde dehydrogenase
METKVLNARTRLERRAEPPAYRQQVTKAVNPATFEVIGSDPMIVCGDANVERAARAAVFGRFCNNGQVCAAVKRVYVHTSVARAFIGRVVACARALRLGPYHDPCTDVGPLANDRAIGTLRSLLHDAWTRAPSWRPGGSRPSRRASTGPRPSSPTSTTPCAS